jgi:flagellar hook-length control protein FliK
MNPILAALLNAPSPAGASASSSSTSSTSAQTQTPSSTDASSAAQFKSQFDQAVAALTNATGPSTQGTNATTTAAQATTAGSTVQSAALADTLADTLQKKIADLLAKGESVTEIVQQLAASLASSLAAQFGGDPAQIQNQLQTAFVSALSPPSTGPPLSTTDLASALAQRFRQVADVAAGVLGETGQSNRQFAGSILDAATTAGVQPAPQPTDNNPTTADSIATDATALLASLTASQGDGKTVATNGAPLIGSNGDTLLGRILTRAAQSQQTSTGSQTQAKAPAVQSGPSSLLTASALAAAVAALDNGPSTQAPVATDASAAAAQRVVANAEATSAANSGSAPAVLATEAPAPLNPAVLAFVKSFSDALASTSAPASAKTASNDTDSGALLSTDVSSSQAPTIGAFAPVQAGTQSDATSANGTQTSETTTPSQAPVDPNLVVDQILRGAFLNTVGSVSTVRLRLVPEELGDVSVKLTIEGNSVSAQVMAQTPAAHDALVAGQAQLTRSLAESGLKLTSFNVDLAGGFASFQQQQQQQSPQQGKSNGRNLLLGGVDTTETDDSSLTAAPNFGPPVLANTSWSALNYLV